MMAVSYIKQFLTRILAFFHRKRPAERKLSLMIPCQVCQSTGIPVGWVCIDCKRPICDECFHEIRETGFNVQCFNPLCGRSTSDSKTIPSLIIVQQNIIQNASVDSNRFSESIFNSPYTLGEILKQVQTRTPLSYILTLPLDQIKVVIYYGFMGTPSITTKMIINILPKDF